MMSTHLYTLQSMFFFLLFALGDSRCFLFSINPYMRVFTCTGYNNHYMYLNQGQQTMPNGLVRSMLNSAQGFTTPWSKTKLHSFLSLQGMGGQHGYFGLWLDCDFGNGHSRARPRCTTYGSPQLSGDEDFKLDTVEVWAVGQPPEEQEQVCSNMLHIFETKKG